MKQNAGQVIYTNKAVCRDCYRCVRVCPVKAIKMYKGQAFVVEERCISCGTCVRECPQGAKTFRNDLEKAIRLISQGGFTAVTIAPSFVSIFGEWERKRLPSAMRKLGFNYVAETSIGAYYVAKKTSEMVSGKSHESHICSACPALVSFVEKYMPHYLDILVPVVSPMIAHGKYIKDKFGPEAKVVFIGPCMAKKAEADRPEFSGVIDCVLTFTELLEWFKREEIDLSRCEESRFNEDPPGQSRYFPLTGGLAKTASMETDMLDVNFLSVSGFDEVKEAMESMKSSVCLLEPLLCPQGCINGPGMPKDKNVFERRIEVLNYAGQGSGEIPSEDMENLLTSFDKKDITTHGDITEEDIRQVLEKTGKGRPENQLNCGACGYSSCRDNAMAVLMDMAESEMCIPYMRRLAEQRTDRIIETSPNGIVILDERLAIISMNPAFKKFFMCSDAICGKQISYLIDPEPFEKLASGEKKLIDRTAKHDAYSLICHELFYRLEEEHQYVGIFVNITNNKMSQETLKNIRSKTIKQARELLEHQISMAQELAKYLGESTARGEELVNNLMKQ